MAESSSTIPVELNQEYRVKLGKSFTFPKENAFHSIKYDFKPKSVDSSQPGRLKVKGDEVSVFMPVLQAESAEDVAIFKGAGKPCRKECILIINTNTGEAILEKISNTVNLKGVRDLTKRKNKVRSISPGPQKAVSQKSSSKNISNNSTTTVQSSKSSGKEKSSKQASQVSEKQQFLTTSANSKAPPISSSSYQSTNILTLPKPISPIRSNNPTPEPNQQVKRSKLSVSSNSDDSSSSFSGSDSDSEMDQSNPSMPTQQFTNAPPTTAMPIFPMNQSTNQISDMPGTYNMPPFLMGGDTAHDTPMGGLANTSMLSLSSTSTSSSEGSSSSSSGSESESDSSDDNETASSVHAVPQHNPPAIQRPRTMSVLKKDLELSDSDDSDL